MKELIDKEPCYHRKLELISPFMKKALSLQIFVDEDINDLVQDTSLILINKKHTYDESKSFWGWAFTILHFQKLRYFTLKKRKKECELLENDYHIDFFDEATPSHYLNKKEWTATKLNKLNKIRKNHMSDREREFLDKFMDGKSKTSIIKEMSLKNQNQYHVWKRRVTTRVKTHSNQY